MRVYDEDKNIKNICAALCEFQSLCPTIEKSTRGFNYKYADLSTIVEAIRPHLRICDLSFTQLISGDHETVTVTTMLMHKSGEYLSAEINGDVNSNRGTSKDGKFNMTPIQAVGNVITYLKRYSLSAMLGIVTDEDVDGVTEKINKQENSKGSLSNQKNNSSDKKIFYGLMNLFIQGMESYKKGSDYLLKCGAKLIDEKYKIFELGKRINGVESSEKWQVSILNDQESIINYKKQFYSFFNHSETGFVDNVKVQELEKVETIEELANKISNDSHE